MKYSEITALTTEELQERLAVEKTNSQNLRFAHSISPLENPLKIKESRKNIAKINTELRNRKLQIAQQ
ncbi:50S ribosomal protein L29 [Adhaeribacter radiodurans]|uniref:Large ribosomal subunit protein uL29 n=1 Tax=Adhaeribacter radiodurans TaxID=2745197 RepID=A0A7L7LBZ8_9BACT|nr:50S ribosomal protein L29 [Adhaeribacter radiodurans]QMU30267.1 50S ribosomal protein L29 [Adhaeribacter radiodurans]